MGFEARNWLKTFITFQSGSRISRNNLIEPKMFCYRHCSMIHVLILNLRTY